MKTKLCSQNTSLIEKEATLEEIYELIKADYTNLDVKEVLSDSIKLIIIKNVLPWAYRGQERIRGGAAGQVHYENI